MTDRSRKVKIFQTDSNQEIIAVSGNLNNYPKLILMGIDDSDVSFRLILTEETAKQLQKATAFAARAA